MDAETKADCAAQILESEVYREAVASARQKLKDAWAQARNAETRESLWQQYQASEAVTTELTIIRNHGIVERHKRDNKEKNRG